jgi:choline dehydrogenase
LKQDTTPIGGVTYPVSTISDSTVSSDPALLAAATEQFLANGSGILTNSGGDYIGWEKLPAAYRANLSPSTLSDLAKFPADWPEIEHVVNSGGATLTESDTGVKNYATIGSSLIAAVSRGNMTIASASMKDKPVISTNWLLEKTDQELAVQAYRRTREIWSHMPPGFIVSI